MPDTPAQDPFPQTRWSLVLKAQAEDHPEATRALADLCRDYYFPLYAYVRRRRTPEDAEDLTQAFFARLIEKNDLQSAGQNRGKLRAYLLTSLKHFLADRQDHDTAQKRGGGQVHVPFDPLDAEQRYCPEPADDNSPDKAFDRRWAISLLEAVIADLRQEYVAADKTQLFDTLRPFLTNPNEDTTTAAETLGMTANNIRVTVFRLRRRYGDLLRQHITETPAPSRRRRRRQRRQKRPLPSPPPRRHRHRLGRQHLRTSLATHRPLRRHRDHRRRVPLPRPPRRRLGHHLGRQR